MLGVPHFLEELKRMLGYRCRSQSFSENREEFEEEFSLGLGVGSVV